MADILIKNIKGLVQVRENQHGPVRGRDMNHLPVLQDAFLLIAQGIIQDYGPMDELTSEQVAKVIDASGRYVFPSFIDSHTHLIFPKSREEEFVMKIRGATYAEIAAKGGGILNSARQLAATSETELLEGAMQRLKEIARTGTGAVEIKSGYGLSLEGELKMLRVAKKLKEISPLKIKSTFLGAHAFPPQYGREEYITLILDEMIPRIQAEGLADYIDVFCEQGFFTEEETKQILARGMSAGMKARVHANQLGLSGGVQAGVAVGALSVDHLEHISDVEIGLLAGSNVMPTALPGAAFFLNLPMPPARKMLDAGLPLTIASDYNPGSAPSGNMPYMISLACIRMRMTPEEAINAATINAAFALELEHELGSITRGKLANIFITEPIPSIAYFPYAFGSSLVSEVILQGKVL